MRTLSWDVAGIAAVIALLTGGLVYVITLGSSIDKLEHVKANDSEIGRALSELKTKVAALERLERENATNRDALADFKIAVANFHTKLVQLEALKEKILGEVTVKVDKKIEVWSQKMQIVEKRLNLYHQNVGKLQREIQSRDDLDREIANYLLTLFEHVDFANYFITQFYMDSPKPNPEIFSYTIPKAAEINQKTAHELKKQLEEQLKKYN